MSLKQIDAAIKACVASAGKTNNLFHTTAMMIARHAAPKELGGHGDCTRALTLVKAMPASMRRTMMVLWFATFTPIRIVEKNDKVAILKDTAKGYTPWDLEGAAATPFFDLAEQNPEGQVYDFEKLVKLVERLGATILKKVEDGKVADEDVPSAKAMAAAITSLKFKRVKAANDAGDQEAPARLQAVG